MRFASTQRLRMPPSGIQGLLDLRSASKQVWNTLSRLAGERPHSAEATWSVPSPTFGCQIRMFRPWLVAKSFWAEPAPAPDSAVLHV